FFQAEDGIRDFHVTGVQTCALPISLQGRTAIVTGAGGGLGREHALYLARKGARVLVNDLGQAAADAVAAEIRTAGGTALAVAGRSEERRVGKEWRSLWAPGDAKNQV